MINNFKAPEHSQIVIENNNCKKQCKSSTHFWSIQELANKYAVPIIHVFSIAKHDKSEVDHVGGPAKTTIQRAIVTGELLKNTTCMIDFFEQKYKDKTNPTYASKETDNNTIFHHT